MASANAGAGMGAIAMTMASASDTVFFITSTPFRVFWPINLTLHYDKKGVLGRLV